METAKKLIEQIDNFKEKLTDGEYLKLVDSLKNLSTNDFYNFTVYCSKVKETVTNEDDSVVTDTEVFMIESLIDDHEQIFKAISSDDEIDTYFYNIFYKDVVIFATKHV